MIKKILLGLLLVNSLSFGALQTDIKPDNTFTDKELLPLFYSMMNKLSKHYYYKDKIDLEKMTKRLDEIKRNGEPLTKESMYALVNLSLNAESGFYTNRQFHEKFAFLFNKESTYGVIKYKDVTYFNLQHITYDDVSKLREYLKAKQPKKIILDLRNNFYSTSLSISAIANFFVSDGIIYSQRYLDSRGKYKSGINKATKKSTIIKDAHINILINEKTAGVAEAMAHSLKFQKNIEVLGQDSGGKSNYFFIEKFNGKDILLLQNGEYFYQRYKILNKIGLNPISRVDEDNKGVDKTLIRALKLLKEKK